VSAESVDVAIVGYGPVGQALALQLGRAGHRIAVFERFQEAYRMPRAVHIDHEVMRLLQDLGLADELAGEMVAVSEYRWFGADGEPLMTLGQPAPSASGWEPDYLFFQPALEATLDRAVAAQPSVTVQRGWAAEKLETATDGARLTVRREQEDGPQGDTREMEARWVVGADGANSFVRESLGIDRRDLGFRERWFVVDVQPRDGFDPVALAPACQWCDPARPCGVCLFDRAWFLGGDAVLVDESAEPVVPADRVGGRRRDRLCWLAGLGRSGAERAVRPMPVVVVDELVQHML
jgi:2-polyprenyl-6-methoxyphenol hydroxylase-like FAD-dependent oxidoreductase